MRNRARSLISITPIDSTLPESLCLSRDALTNQFIAILFVIDLTTDYLQALTALCRLAQEVDRAHQSNHSADRTPKDGSPLSRCASSIIVLLHKCDVLSSQEATGMFRFVLCTGSNTDVTDIYTEICTRMAEELSLLKCVRVMTEPTEQQHQQQIASFQESLDPTFVPMTFFLTSIYDRSLGALISSIVQNQLEFSISAASILDSLYDVEGSNASGSRALLFDTSCGLALATDTDFALQENISVVSEEFGGSPVLADLVAARHLSSSSVDCMDRDRLDMINTFTSAVETLEMFLDLQSLCSKDIANSESIEQLSQNQSADNDHQLHANMGGKVRLLDGREMFVFPVTSSVVLILVSVQHGVGISIPNEAFVAAAEKLRLLISKTV